MDLPPPTWIPEDGPCQYCKAVAALKKDTVRQFDPQTGEPVNVEVALRLCDDCGVQLPVYPGMGGSGYESATVGHYHLESAGRLALRNPVMRELCADCYRVDYQKQFPGAPDPV